MRPEEKVLRSGLGAGGGGKVGHDGVKNLSRTQQDLEHRSIADQLQIVCSSFILKLKRIIMSD